jgi:hypothetical protein
MHYPLAFTSQVNSYFISRSDVRDRTHTRTTARNDSEGITTYVDATSAK